jgi:hypothetical protein
VVEPEIANVLLSIGNPQIDHGRPAQCGQEPVQPSTTEQGMTASRPAPIDPFLNAD